MHVFTESTGKDLSVKALYTSVEEGEINNRLIDSVSLTRVVSIQLKINKTPLDLHDICELWEEFALVVEPSFEKLPNAAYVTIKVPVYVDHVYKTWILATTEMAFDKLASCARHTCTMQHEFGYCDR